MSIPELYRETIPNTTYFVVQYERPVGYPKDWPETFWSYSDERGWGPSLGWLSNWKATKEEAIQAALTSIARHRAVERARTMQPTRADYEAACSELDISPLSDAYILSAAYALRYAEYREGEDDKYRSQPIHRQRLEHLDAAREAARPVVTRPADVLANCGHYCSPDLLMSASLGTSCPECYDRMDEGPPQ